MTRQQHNESEATEFSQWLRVRHQNLIGSHTFSAQNLDFIWHNYKENWFITIEEKRYGGMQNHYAQKAQRDTHGVVTQLLEKASGQIINTMRGWRKCEYRGHYEIVFSHTNPTDGWIWINNQHVTEAGLLTLLTTGRLPEPIEAIAK